MIAGILLGLGASASWAIANVAIARSARQLGALRALLWAQVAGIVLVALVAPFTDVRTVAPGAADAGWIAASGVVALVAYGALFYAFEHGRLTVAVPVMSSWAVLASGLSLILLHERVRPGQACGAAAVVAGAVIVSRYAQSGSEGPAGSRRWLLASFAAAIAFGVLVPLLGRLAPVAGSIGAIGIVYVADIALGVPLALRARVRLALPEAGTWLPVALAGLFETGGFACITLGARYAPLALVSPLASLASAFTVTYAWMVLGERPPRPVLLGAALACAGVILLAL